MGVINGSFVKVFHDKLTSRNIEPFIVSPILSFPFIFCMALEVTRLLFILFGFQEIKIRNNKRNGPRVNADQR